MNLISASSEACLFYLLDDVNMVMIAGPVAGLCTGVMLCFSG